jgi:putative ABC transport system permease protein
MIIRQGMSLALIGLVVGAAGSLLFTRMLSSLLFGVTATDPIIFTLVFALIGAMALAACLVPAWRAARVDPLVALRHE